MKNLNKGIKNTIADFCQQHLSAQGAKKDFLERNIKDLLLLLPEDERDGLNCLEDGIGDKLETIFKATGIYQATKAIERITGKDCGCAKRKQALNEWGKKLNMGA